MNARLVASSLHQGGLALSQRDEARRHHNDADGKGK
jgi:hypothetical protein